MFAVSLLESWQKRSYLWYLDSARVVRGLAILTMAGNIAGLLQVVWQEAQPYQNPLDLRYDRSDKRAQIRPDPVYRYVVVGCGAEGVVDEPVLIVSAEHLPAVVAQGVDDDTIPLISRAALTTSPGHNEPPFDLRVCLVVVVRAFGARRAS